ncbi:MAG: PASTA domain-containing protein [Acidimicrobiia bacterium]|nr:PASTA domain-containing protein [Acidimicrobiia bacterium]
MAPRPTSTGPPPPRRSPWAVAAVVIVLLLLAGLVGFLIVDQLGDDSGPATADVPGVVGLTIDEARSTLEEAGFEVDEERVANEDVPEDEVFDQEPPEGTKLRKGQPVTLKVSAGQGTVEVPNVVGDSADDARAAIEAAGLVFVPQFEESERPVGTVIRTDPPVGEELERGTEVTVFLAVAEQVEVPEVEGLDAVTAANQLGARGFVTRQVTEPSDDFATGQVIRTEPPAGELVPKGETIVMFVSSGPETARVPNVVNLSESAAREALAGDGFTNVVVVGVTVANPASAGKVVAQDPVAGTTWPLGDTVTLQIGQTPPTTTTSAPPPTTTTVAP